MIIAKADFDKRVRMRRAAIKRKTLPLFPCSLAMHDDRIAPATNRFYLSYKNGKLPHSTLTQATASGMKEEIISYE
jgi:hypothetical protein